MFCLFWSGYSFFKEGNHFNISGTFLFCLPLSWMQVPATILLLTSGRLFHTCQMICAQHTLSQTSCACFVESLLFILHMCCCAWTENEPHGKSERTPIGSLTDLPHGHMQRNLSVDWFCRKPVSWSWTSYSLCRSPTCWSMSSPSGWEHQQGRGGTSWCCSAVRRSSCPTAFSCWWPVWRCAWGAGGAQW